MAATSARSPLHAAAPVPAPVPAAGRRPVDYVWAAARISIGWVFLWAFLDKTFGWGFATPAAKAWINGGSPTTGFLKGTGENALGGFFSSLAGQVWVDWMFMAGLLGVGLALVLGVGTRIAAGAGTAMLTLMWAAELPLTTNPFMDDHIVYSIVLVGLTLGNAGATLGLGNLPIVRRTPWLR